MASSINPVVNMPTAFDWDDGKAASVHSERGIRFEVAIGVFADPNRIDFEDARSAYGEERRVVIGTVDRIILTVVYAMRGDVCRIITAWRSSRRERRLYHGEGDS